MAVQLTDSEVKEIAASVLFEFDKVCRNNEIGYSIFYGTLLGAVRHSGYIPWDNDIDVMMTRNNYNKLRMLIADRDPFQGKIKLMDLSSEKRFSAPLAKLIDTRTELTQNGHAEKVALGVYVDVFVFDKVPQELKKRKKLFRQSEFLQRLWVASEMKPVSTEKNVIKKAIKAVLNSGMARTIAIQMEHRAEKSSSMNADSTLYSNLLYSTDDRMCETFSEELITNVRDYNFEKQLVIGAADYDTVLRRYYGEYMNFPPEEQRVPNHDFVATWK